MGWSVILANTWAPDGSSPRDFVVVTAELSPFPHSDGSARLSKKDFPRSEVHKLLSLGIRSSKCSQVMTTRKLLPALALQVILPCALARKRQTQHQGVLPTSVAEEPAWSSSCWYRRIQQNSARCPAKTLWCIAPLLPVRAIDQGSFCSTQPLCTLTTEDIVDQ